MTFTLRQILAASLLVAVSVLIGFFVPSAAPYLMALGALGAAAVLVASSAAPSHFYAELSLALREACEGKPPAAPLRASPEQQRLHAELERLAQVISQTQHLIRSRSSEEQVLVQALEQPLGQMRLGLEQRKLLCEQSLGLVSQLSGAAGQLQQHVEQLDFCTEQSLTSLGEMTHTHGQVTTKLGELTTSVRDAGSSIEQMTQSVREVSKNIETLSLAADETSASMNKMNLSIDQVHSNANQTSRLSEEVAQDAQRGAEAILKTIGEIFRIKESAQEAVAVISNLGSRIDAIGQILSVIDDVAEQTNLLALNAAIIAAQAGEHGKGFAVVADEIKDLAERAGASTKEIAELTRTIQNESKNAIAAVERGAKNVDRGVEVSNEAEHALHKILESTQKSTDMVRAIALATVEQSTSSRQVTEAIGRIALMVQQIASATGQQTRGSELIVKSAESMRSITQQVERSSQEQTRQGQKTLQNIDSARALMLQLREAQKGLGQAQEALVLWAQRLHDAVQSDSSLFASMQSALGKLKDQRPPTALFVVSSPYGPPSAGLTLPTKDDVQ